MEKERAAAGKRREAPSAFCFSRGARLPCLFSTSARPSLVARVLERVHRGVYVRGMRTRVRWSGSGARPALSACGSPATKRESAGVVAPLRPSRPSHLSLSPLAPFPSISYETMIVLRPDMSEEER